MDKYTASNGYRVAVHEEKPNLGWAIYDSNGENTLANSYSHLNDIEMKALREFFRAEEDERLGRWRWPENPAFVCYEHDRGVFVLDERDGREVLIHRGHVVPGLPDYTAAAAAYFDAHPEPSYTVAEWVAKAMYESENGAGTWEHVPRMGRGARVRTAEVAIAKYEEIR